MTHALFGLSKHMSAITEIDPSSKIPSKTVELREELTKSLKSIVSFLNFPYPHPAAILGMAGGIRFMSLMKRISEKVGATESVPSVVSSWHRDQAAIFARAIEGLSAFLSEFMETENLVGLRDTIPENILELAQTTSNDLIKEYSEGALSHAVDRLIPQVSIPKIWENKATSSILEGQSVIHIVTKKVTDPSSASPETKAFFERIQEIAKTPESVLTDKSAKEKIREIGQEIYNQHGHAGMVAVCEYNRQYHPFIERAWDHIGQWLA
jgi:hypothetical protein